MNKKVTVTIGIPAYNEAANISNILLSLFKQKQENFVLTEIIIASDASTDNTPEIVNTLKKRYPIIRLLKNKERKGKYFRVNQLFTSCKTHILIVLDADIAIEKSDFLSKLVRVLVTDPEAQMVVGHNIMLQPSHFMGKVIHANFTMWDAIRWSVPAYKSAANFYGTATAYRGSFVRSVSIPEDLTDPHLFIYLSADKVNGFRYCKEAVVLQWPLSTVSDYMKFSNRSIGKRDKKLEKMFGVKIEDVYYFSRGTKVKGIMKAFLQRPFYTPLAILFGYWIAHTPHQGAVNKSPVWDITQSSKKPITFASKK